MVEDTAIAAMKPMASTPVPACRNGTASGMSDPSTAVDEAKADTTAPMKHSSSAAISGDVRPATL